MKYFITLFFICLISNLNAEIKYFETFDTKTNLWWTGVEDNFTAEIKNGKYVIDQIAEDRYKIVWVQFDVYYERDFSIKTVMKQLSGVNNHGYGIIWASENVQNLYYFVISSNGQSCIYRKNDGKWEEVSKWREFAPINEMGETNTLELIQRDKKLSFLINGESYLDTTGFSPLGNYIGFIVNNTMNIEVESLEINYETSEINIIENPVLNTAKINLGPNVNSAYSEITPIITTDGKKLYFTRKNHPDNYGSDKKDDIYYSVRDNKGNWGKAVHVGSPLNNYGNNAVIAVSADGNTLSLMNQYKPDGSDIKGGGLSRTHRTAMGWTIPQDIELVNYYNNNPYSWENECISADNQIFILAAQRDDSYGNNDLYVSFWENGKYSEPKNLGPTINTFELEMSPYLAADNKTLYFATSGHPGYGSEDIFMAKRLDDTWTNWTEPKNLGPGINSANSEAYFTIPASGEYAYMTIYTEESSNDIFQIELTEESKPEPVVLIYGKVLNSKTNEPIGTIISYNELQTDIEAGLANSDPKSGDYKIVLPYGKSYSFLAEKEGFYSVSENIELTQISEYKEIERNLYLTPIEIGESFRLNNIFFDYDKYDLRPESYPELKRLIKLLNENPNIKIEISGHTDSQGNEQYNLKLSENRAKSVLNYLLSQNISQTRLTSKGYGESIPVKSNESEEGRQFNRRVEVKILRK